MEPALVRHIYAMFAFGCSGDWNLNVTKREMKAPTLLLLVQNGLLGSVKSILNTQYSLEPYPVMQVSMLVVPTHILRGMVERK